MRASWQSAATLGPSFSYIVVAKELKEKNGKNSAGFHTLIKACSLGDQKVCGSGVQAPFLNYIRSLVFQHWGAPCTWDVQASPFARHLVAMLKDRALFTISVPKKGCRVCMCVSGGLIGI